METGALKPWDTYLFSDTIYFTCVDDHERSANYLAKEKIVLAVLFLILPFQKNELFR